MAEILRRHQPIIQQRFGDRMPRSHRRAMADIIACRTPLLGGSLYTCSRQDCAALDYAYHSCRNRHCPKCHGCQTEDWLDRIRQRLLSCPYYLITFTLPARLRKIARSNQRLVYDLLLRHAAGTVLDLAQDPRWLGVKPGILAVLHTWSRDMSYHPHVHLLVTAGGIVTGQRAWRHPKNNRFLLPGYVLSKIFRARILQHLDRAGLLRLCPPPPAKQQWVVHVQHAGDGRKALDYLARYVYRVAISNSSIHHADHKGVTFTYRHSRTQLLRSMTLEPIAFISRFLQHVLPRGFVKVRHYGLFASNTRKRLELARVLLESHSPPTENIEKHQSETEPKPTTRTCPVCGKGQLLLRQPIPRNPRWQPHQPSSRAPP